MDVRVFLSLGSSARAAEVAALALKAMSEDPDVWDDPDVFERMHWDRSLRDARATEIPIPQNAGAPSQTAVAAPLTHEDYADIAIELGQMLEQHVQQGAANDGAVCEVAEAIVVQEAQATPEGFFHYKAPPPNAPPLPMVPPPNCPRPTRHPPGSLDEGVAALGTDRSRGSQQTAVAAAQTYGAWPGVNVLVGRSPFSGHQPTLPGSGPLQGKDPPKAVPEPEPPLFGAVPLWTH